MPATHSPVIADNPVVAQYDPAEQVLHALNPNDAAKVPTGQFEQTVAEEVEYFPVTQLPVTVVNPAVAQYEPAVQAEQEVEPVDA